VFSQALLVKNVTDMLFGQCTFSKSHQTTVLAADHRPAHYKKDRDLDHAHTMGRIIPDSGEALTRYHPMFNKTDTSCCQIKMGMVAYLGVDHHMFNKTDTTCQQVNLGMVAYLSAV